MILDKNSFKKSETESINQKKHDVDNRPQKNTIKEFLNNGESIIWKSKAHTEKLAKSKAYEDAGTYGGVYIDQKIGSGFSYNGSNLIAIIALIILLSVLPSLGAIVFFVYKGIYWAIIFALPMLVLPFIMGVVYQKRLASKYIDRKKWYILTNERLLIFEKLNNWALDKSINMSEIKSASLVDYVGKIKDIGSILVYLNESDKVLLCCVENSRDVCMKLNGQV